MSTVVLSAASPELPSVQALSALLMDQLGHAGETDVRLFELATTKLAYCQGEFDCWVKTPGICRAHDAEDAIVRAIHDADTLVMLDAVTFGGHSYTVKRAQDRLICLLAPFFEKRASLTHHDARYAHTASFFALGWMPVADPEATETWRALADANALNMLAPRVGAAVLEDASRAGWSAAMSRLLGSTDVPGSDITGRDRCERPCSAAATGVPGTPGLAPPRTVAFVVGSAKAKGTSASENLARALGCPARAGRRGDGRSISPRTSFATSGPRRRPVPSLMRTCSCSRRPSTWTRFRRSRPAPSNA